MGLFRKDKAGSSKAKSRGMRFTEGLLPVFGPAQVGDSTKPVRPLTEEESARNVEFQQGFERKVAADGSVYYVSKDS